MSAGSKSNAFTRNRTGKSGLYKVREYTAKPYQPKTYQLRKVEEFQTKQYVNIERDLEIKRGLEFRPIEYNNIRKFGDKKDPHVRFAEPSEIHSVKASNTTALMKLRQLVKSFSKAKKIKPQIRHMSSPTPSQQVCFKPFIIFAY